MDTTPPRQAAGAPVAGYDDDAQERWVPEAPKSSARTAFERDRARLVHSSALRRLGAKTQVLGPGTDDFVRTRLTHSLEVAQVGRELGKALGCDPDVVDTACLAHDLGHPPFGHNGERALADIARDIGGFEGNAQTLRLLTRLEPKRFSSDGRPAGLNLTRASLDAATKYPWTAPQAPVRADGTPTPKFGAYADDLPVFDWLRRGVPGGTDSQARCIEADVMDLADDIAYCVHDVEDAIVGGRIDLALLADGEARDAVVEAVHAWYGRRFDEAALERAIERLLATGDMVSGFDGSRRALAALKDSTSQLIGRFSRAAQDATRDEYGDGLLTRYAARLVVPGATLAEILVLKGVAVAYVMAPREEEPLYLHQRQVVADLAGVLLERAPGALELPFAADFEAAPDDAGRLRVIVDQVASLTDVSALQLHARLVRA